LISYEVKQDAPGPIHRVEAISASTFRFKFNGFHPKSGRTGPGFGTDGGIPTQARRRAAKASDAKPTFQIDDGPLMNQLPVWAPDATTRRTIVLDNRARLYQSSTSAQRF
jgi:hypothetical protein